LDKILIGTGIGLGALGVGFLVASPSMFEIRQPLILGGLLWLVTGSITTIIGRSVGTNKSKQLGVIKC